MKGVVAAELRAIFTASDRAATEVLLRAMVTRYRDSAPRLSAWLEENVPEGLTVLTLPEGHAAHHRLLARRDDVHRAI